ncbi:MAG: M20/M25/M40 family metallo-hydrolase [Gemmatimonadaceae bacterium]|nr:M20/M25/M40 family metallo-hydrolase [Gemmatimonadaceae bacterium]
MRKPVVTLLLACVTAAPGGAQSAVAAWTLRNQRPIVEEFASLLAIPNVARNDADMRRNAEWLAASFRKRGFTVETQAVTSGAPVILATLEAQPSSGVLTLYIHYDGQPVDSSEWTRCGPFAPCVWSPAGTTAPGAFPEMFDPDARIYARSASDDKAPIMALLAAVDALKATGQRPTWSLRVVLDGQEEAGSANFRRFVASDGAKLTADLVITLDGPRHPGGRPTMYYGVRGSAGVTVTVFSSRNDLHSGNYGNWAPDASIRLGRLLASMKDDEGRVLIDGFYDDVTPLTPTERRALAAAPDVEAVLAREFGVARPERPTERLEVKLNEPTLNVLQMESGGGFSAPGRTAIPATATARIAMRLVHGLDPQKMNERVIAHVRKQGYFVVVNRAPTEEERLAHPLLARVDARGGNRAVRVSMDEPLAQAVARALTRGPVTPVQLPTLGGSMPFGEFSEGLKLPTVGVSLVNHDNNQHGPDENLRLRNLWEGIDLLASILTMPRPGTSQDAAKPKD